MIDFSFSEEQQELRNNIIAFSQAHFNHGVGARDAAQRFDQELWKKAGEIHLPGLSIPKAYGGLELDIISTACCLEALGYGCEDNGLSFAIGAHLLACAVPLALFGRDVQKEHFLPNLVNGTWIAACAMTEEKGGSDIFNMQAAGKLVNEHYMLEGQKTFVSNAPVADIVLAYVATDKSKGWMGGISCFVLDNEHFSSSDPVSKMGLRSCMMGNVSLKDKPVNKEALLGKPGAGMMIFNESMLWERIGLTAIHLGVISRLLDKTLQFVKNREVYGKPIKEYQAVSHRLADIKSSLSGARWSMYHAAWCLKNKDKAGLYASIAKLQVSEIYKQSCLEFLQIHGAIGYLENHEVERSLRDAAASTLYSGTSEIQRNVIFGHLIDSK